MILYIKNIILINLLILLLSFVFFIFYYFILTNFLFFIKTLKGIINSYSDGDDLLLNIIKNYKQRMNVLANGNNELNSYNSLNDCHETQSELTLGT